MIRCLIVDDEWDALDVMTHYVQQTPGLELIKATSNPLEALQIAGERQVDLIFLDIQMPQLSGLDVVKALGGRVRVVLTTAYSEFAVDAYDLDVVDYLLKPIPFPRFLGAVQRAARQINEAEAAALPDGDETYLFVKTESKGKLLKIELADIDYVEAMNNYVALHAGGKKTLVYTTMKELDDRLSKRHFIRVHKSFIVAINRIAGIEGNLVRLKGVPAPVTVSESYKPALMQLIQNSIVK